MRTMIEQPPTHLSSYHDEVGLVIQFILHEMIQSFQEIQEITRLLDKSPKTRTNIAKSIKVILDLMIRLSGSGPVGAIHLFNRNFHSGTLMKLKNYCSTFLGKAGESDSYLLEAAEKSWVLSLQALDIIHHFNTQSPPSSNEWVTLRGVIEKMSHSIRSVASQVSQVIIPFKNDENIIYFILRFHQELDELYGHKFTIRLLEKMYPKGRNGVESYLTRRYTQRGFQSQIPKILAHLERIYE